MTRSGAWLVAVVLLASGCGGETPTAPAAGSPGTGSVTQSPAATERGAPAFDPPKQFSGDGVYVGPENAAIGRETAYSVAEVDGFDDPVTLQALSLMSGKSRWRQPVNTKSNPPGDPAPAPEVVIQPDGKESVIYTGLRVTPGTGTQQDRQQIVVGALDGGSGARQWEVQADLPAEFEPSRTRTGLAGATERYAVSTVDQSGQLPRSLVVDLQARAAAWAEPGFLAIGLDGTRVIGTKAESEYISSGPLQAMDAAGRAPLWTGKEAIASYEATVGAPGIGTMQVSEPFKSRTLLLDLATGAQVADLPDRYKCTFDQRSVLVCEGYDTLIALDISTKKELWRLPDAATGRVRPKLHTAFHGLVYAEAQRGPVFLDARTGQDAVVGQAIAPDVASVGFGLVNKDKKLYAYPATG